MTSLEQIVLPLAESRSLVDAGIVLDTALVWGMDYQETTEVFTRQYAADTFPDFETFCPAPVLSEMTTWLMCHDCDDITFTNETADGENAVGARCNNSEGKEFEAHEADELQAAAALLMEVSR